MTRTFQQTINCPNCQHSHTVETDFERWMRNEPCLDARAAGIVRFDLDVLLHKYGVEVNGRFARDIQAMMFVEVKTHLADVNPAQLDTLALFNQVLRTEALSIDHVIAPTRSRKVLLRLYGGHVLRLSGTDPENSDLIFWDNQPITKLQLLELLRFERNPDDPQEFMNIYTNVAHLSNA